MKPSITLSQYEYLVDCVTGYHRLHEDNPCPGLLHKAQCDLGKLRTRCKQIYEYTSENASVKNTVNYYRLLYLIKEKLSQQRPDIACDLVEELLQTCYSETETYSRGLLNNLIDIIGGANYVDMELRKSI